ncbi:methylated-DNA--[protein]-cysteine S-methyltransferase [Hahella sp. NBU794]|uniref:methylated-DNA--[protein]-cysteine S-methyltransferase n=1 Tax=Hahella sp. NBU794 TaxID=3422590 RepID=UPI003D6F00BD
MIDYIDIDSPLGRVRLAAQNGELTGCYFDGQKYYPELTPAWRHHPDCVVLQEAARQLELYFAGQLQRFDLPLAPKGTAFQQEVWRALSDIESGRLSTYQQIANFLGRPRATRAVGAAVGRNPLSVIIPCHRVIGGNGSLTGYAGGLNRKQALLELEKAPL